MKLTKTSLYIAILTATVGITACSSSSSSDPAASKTTIGRITGFGSVFVGGVEYETDSTTITKDGVPANGDSDLKVGMIVTVKGSANGNQGVAHSIEFTDDLEGIVTENTLTNPDGTPNPNGSLSIMGQTVTVDSTTNFESKDPTIVTPADIPAGAIVEVSGYNDGNGNILASYIELKAKDMASYSHDMEVKGIISNLIDNPDGTYTFNLGPAKVVTTANTRFDDINPSDLANDLYVEVKSKPELDADGNLIALIALKVELEDDGDYDHDGEHGEEMEVEGYITAIADDAGSIEVDGRNILIPEGMDISAYAVGDMVEIEFRIDEEGNAVAYKIEREDGHGHDDDDMEIKGWVDEIDPDNATITVNGKVIHVDKYNAIMMDKSSSSDKYFSIDSLRTGDRVEVEAYMDKDGNYVAVKVEREDD